jgi:hypothetical protein
MKYPLFKERMHICMSIKFISKYKPTNRILAVNWRLHILDSKYHLEYGFHKANLVIQLDWKMEVS